MRSAVGLGLLLVVGLAGMAGMAVLSTGGGPWIANAFVLVVVAGAGLYIGHVLIPHSRCFRLAREEREGQDRTESRLVAALRELQAGDLPGAQQYAAGLSGELETALIAAIRTLGALVQQIQTNSVEVAGAGEAVHGTAGELASGSSQQAAAVMEITATTEELARTAAQIARNAASQADLATGAERAGTVGAAAVADAVAGVEGVLTRISGIAARADTLGGQSREIYRVLDLINEISQETHILALNAAIEASAAGDHGRRFSVVADEVRRLAQRSRESVDSVRLLLDEFASSIRATVIATEEGSKEAARVLERARAAAVAIEELRDAIGTTARAASEISLATDQQRTASDQVVMTLKELSQVIQRIAEGLKAFTGAAERLNRTALSIQLLTQTFHSESPRSLKHVAGRWAVEVAERVGHWDAVESRLEEFLVRSPFVEVAYLVDRTGNMILHAINPGSEQGGAATAPVTAGANYGDRPWFQAVLREQRTILTPLYDSLLTGERCFTVATPVPAADGAMAGVLGFDVNVRGWARI